MNKLIVQNGTILTEEAALSGFEMLCIDGKIAAIAPTGTLNTQDAQILDATGKIISPGFIDMHIHGTLGHLVDNGKKALEELSVALPQYGVTSYLPTVLPCPDEIGLLKELVSVKSQGSEILGFFFEGHYLKLSGAISGLVADYSEKRLFALLEAAQGNRMIFGVSPEIKEMETLIPHMVKQGGNAFITHTHATADQTTLAIELGARHATHFYNVFPYIGDREGGVRGCGTVEAVLADERTTVDFILDGEHVQPIAVKMALTCKGPDKVCLVTDANTSAGLPEGFYAKGISGKDFIVEYPGGPARMTDENGKPGGLAGSGLTMDKAVRNAVAMLGVSLPQAVRMASANPARVLGIGDHKGRLAQGYDADFILLDESLHVDSCYISATEKYTKK